jgi:hypothetical protein
MDAASLRTISSARVVPEAKIRSIARIVVRPYLFTFEVMVLAGRWILVAGYMTVAQIVSPATRTSRMELVI